MACSARSGAARRSFWRRAWRLSCTSRRTTWKRWRREHGTRTVKIPLGVRDRTVAKRSSARRRTAVAAPPGRGTQPSQGPSDPAACRRAGPAHARRSPRPRGRGHARWPPPARGQRRWGCATRSPFTGSCRTTSSARFHRARSSLRAVFAARGGGVAVLEAAAANVPVVGTRVGFVSDWDGAAAVAVPPGDPSRLAAAIVQLLENPQRRHAIAHVAREWVERYDADHTAAAMTELYRSLR